MLGLHHLALRRRVSQNLESYPHPTMWKRRFDYAMYFIGLMAPIALIPQALELYSTRDAHSLSLPTWVVLGGINLLWSFYGILHKEPPIAIANFFSGLLNIIIAIGIILYR